MRRPHPLRPLAVLGAFLAGLSAARAQSGPPSFTLFTERDGLTHPYVTALVQDRVGFLWVGTDDGLNRFDGRTFRPYRRVPGQSGTLSHARITALHETPEGTLWVGTQAGLNRFDRDRQTFDLVPLVGGPAARSASLYVNDLAHDRTGRLWVATTTGLFYHDANRGHLVSVPPLAGAPQLTGTNAPALFTLPDGDVWVTFSERPSGCRIDPVRRACDPARVLTYALHAVLADGLGEAWFLQRERSGASLLIRPDASARRYFASFPSPHTSPSYRYAEGPGRALWLGSSLGLVQIDPAGPSATLLLPADVEGSLRGTQFNEVYADRQGTVWVGSTRGLHRWAPSRFDLFRHADAFPGTLSSDLVNALFEARDGTLWVTTNYGLNRLEPGATAFRRYFADAPSNQATNGFWAVYQDRAGTLWLGSKNFGVFRFDHVRDRLVPEPIDQALLSTMSPVKVRQFYEDRTGTLWASASGGLLARDARTGRWRGYSARNAARHGLRAPSVNLSFEDHAGILWLGADDGLYRYDRAADRFIHYPPDPTGRRGPFSPIIWSLAELPQEPGVLWIGTIGGGLSRLDTRTGRFTFRTTADGLPSNTIYGLVADRGGALWMSTNAGLARLHPRTSTLTRFSVEDGLQGNQFDFMAYHGGSSGRLYFGGPRGFNRFHPDSVRALRGDAPLALTEVRVGDQIRRGAWETGDTLVLGPDERTFDLGFAALDLLHARRYRYRYQLTGVDPAWRQADPDQPFAAYTNVPPGTYTFELAAAPYDAPFPAPAFRLTVVAAPRAWETRLFRTAVGLLLLALLGRGFYAVYRRRLGRLERRQADEREVLRRLGERQDRERLRIAQELHDGPVQGLYTIGHALDHLADHADGLGGEVRSVRSALDGVSDELRDVLVTLRPTLVEHLGVAAALDAYLRRLAQRQPDLAVETAFATDGRDLPLPVQHALFRIGQEALHNAEKHAGAQHLHVGLQQSGPLVTLVVQDDGAGFDVPESFVDLARRERFGLVGASERAEVLGGSVTITSRPGMGTTVRAVLPATAEGLRNSAVAPLN